jgi:hypothetical protein
MALNSALSSFSFGGTVVAEVGTASVALNRPALESTAIGAKTQSFVVGVGGATANLEIFYDQSSAAHTTLENNINTGAAAAVACILTLASGQTYTGDAYVTSFEVTAQAGSLVRANVGLQFTNIASASIIVTIA